MRNPFHSRLAVLALGLVLTSALFLLLRQHRSPNSQLATPVNPAQQSVSDQDISFRILLGLKDTSDTPWDGSLMVTPGSLAATEPWRFDDGDHLERSFPGSGEVRWKLSTRRAPDYGLFKPIIAKSIVTGWDLPKSMAPNGVIVTFRNLSATSEVYVKTVQGNFGFRPADIPCGEARKFLDGRSMVDRVPAGIRLTNSRDDQDYPAAVADREGNVWVAYLQFRVSPKFQSIRVGVTESIKDFTELAEPSGGDQILLLRYAAGSRSDPVPVSEAGGDLYKPAVAVDASEQVWVFWSANIDGNFDLYARSFNAGRPGKTLRLSTGSGPNICPVAATDAQGCVWVAWQAFREGRFQICAARQQGAAFRKETVVASSTSNEWNPAIATSPDGEVAVAWDSYRNGNYDVYFRIFDKAGRLGSERPGAISARYEAYPSLAYDVAGRLWLAWEESEEGWGKDWGAYRSTGIGLYQGRSVRVRVWQGEHCFEPGHLDGVLPGVPSAHVDNPGRQGDTLRSKQPDPRLAKERRPHEHPEPPPRPLNSYPRLLADRSGRIWLAYRTAHPFWRVPRLGGVWFENVVSFDGSEWSNPIYLPHSDNLLDNRPALLATAAGELLIVGSSDGRQQLRLTQKKSSLQEHRFLMEEDPNNNDLFAWRITLPASLKPAELNPSSPLKAGGVSASEPPNIRKLREYRVRANGVEYRILRGEFHRHTEISHDGESDGSLWDAWRYALDCAALDWIGCCDHNNGSGREYPWWIIQKLTDVFLLPGSFTPMFSYERSIAYPEGHRNVVFARRGVRPLPALPTVDEKTSGSAPDTRMLYAYLRQFNGIAAVHNSATSMGTDWRDNDPLREPIVEIYQGGRQNYEMPEAPRSISPIDFIDSSPSMKAEGFVSEALKKGYRLGFQASSDHWSTHMSYCNLYCTATTREAILEALMRRRIYGATDDILADIRSGDHMMGSEFETAELPRISVKLVGTAPFAKVHVIKNNHYAYTIEPKASIVQFTWLDTVAEAGKTSYYYVRGEQEDGEIVWVSPMWIKYK